MARDRVPRRRAARATSCCSTFAAPAARGRCAATCRRISAAAASSSCGKRALRVRSASARTRVSTLIVKSSRTSSACGSRSVTSKSIYGAARSARASHNIMCAPTAPTCAAQCSTARRRSGSRSSRPRRRASKLRSSACSPTARTMRPVRAPFRACVTTLRRLLARAESEPIAAEVADPRTGEPTPAALDRDTIVNLLRGALYTRMTRAVVPFAVDAAARETSRRCSRSASRRANGRRRRWRSVSRSAFCAARTSRRAPRTIPWRLTTTTGFLRDSYYRGFAAACEAWPTTPLPPTMLAPLRATTPALAISGEAIRSPRRRWATRRSRSSQRRCT